MAVTREDAEDVLQRVHTVLAMAELPSLQRWGLCYLLMYVSAPVRNTTVYDVVGKVFNYEIPYYRDECCPPEWKAGIWSEERMTLLCMLGALSADDIVEMCQ